MTDPSLADYDPVAIALRWLSTHPKVTAALGGSGRVIGDNEPPYPCLRLTNPPGSDGTLRWVLGGRIALDVFGDIDGTPGKAAMRRILYVALDALTELPTQEYSEGEAVVTRVVSSMGGGWMPEPTGQPRWTAEVTLYGHPPRVALS